MPFRAPPSPYQTRRLPPHLQTAPHGSPAHHLLPPPSLSPPPCSPRSQTAATIADLFFTAQAFDVAEEAVRLAVTAAEQAQQYGLMIKLSNNLAAVHRNKGE